MIADVVHPLSLGICQILSQFWVMMPGCGRGLQDSSALAVERDIDVIYCVYIYITLYIICFTSEDPDNVPQLRSPMRQG